MNPSSHLPPPSPDLNFQHRQDDVKKASIYSIYSIYQVIPLHYLTVVASSHPRSIPTLVYSSYLKASRESQLHVDESDAKHRQDTPPSLLGMIIIVNSPSLVMA